MSKVEAYIAAEAKRNATFAKLIADKKKTVETPTLQECGTAALAAIEKILSAP